MKACSCTHRPEMRPAPGSRPSAEPFRSFRALGWLVLPGLVAAGCDRFEAVSVYPPLVYDDEQAQVYIYGQGFEPGATAVLAWKGTDGTPVSAPIEQIEVLDGYTMRGTLPDVAGLVPHPIYPYQEFVTLSESYTPGLYACGTGDDGTPQPELWDGSSTGPYCDADGNRLAYVGPNDETPVIPPGSGDDTVLDYASWYDLLDYCTWFLSPDTTLEEEHLSLLVPDYGLGCFYPSDSHDDDGRPTTYSYCPLQLPAVEVDVVVTLPDGRRSEISRALTLVDWTLDYYWNPRYGTRIKGFFDVVQQIGLDRTISASTLGDIDADGYSDILTATDDAAVTILGGPSFDVLATVDTGETTAPTLVEVADFDGDTGESAADWVTAHSAGEGTGAGKLVFLFDVDPVSGQAAARVAVDLPFEPSSLALADLDQDALMDVVAGGGDSDGKYVVTTILQDTQSPRSFAVSAPFIEGDAPMDVAVGNLDANQAADIVVARPDEAVLSIWYNDGTGIFADVLPQTLDSETVTGPIATFRDTSSGGLQPPRVVDITGDGTVDIVALDRESGRIVVFYEGDSGPLSSSATLALDMTAVQVTLALANADAAPDILVGDDAGNVSIITNHLPAQFTTLSSTLVATGIDGILAHDLDGDGYADIAVVDGAAGQVSILANTYTSIGLYFYYTLAQCTL